MAQRRTPSQPEAMGRKLVRQVERYLQWQVPKPKAQPADAWEKTTVQVENLIGHLSTLAIRNGPDAADAFFANADQIFDMVDGRDWPKRELTVPPRHTTDLTVPPKMSKELTVIREPAPVSQEDEWWPPQSGELDLGDNEQTLRISLYDQPTMRMRPVTPAWVRQEAPTEVLPVVDGGRIVDSSGWMAPGYLRGSGMVEF